MAAGAGKVALVSSTTLLTGACATGAVVVDFVGYGSSANCSEASPTATLTNTTAALRISGGAQDTNNNSADFVVDAPTPRSTAVGNLGVSAPATTLVRGETSLLAVTVAPGTNPASTGVHVVVDLTALDGSATQEFFDDGTHGDMVPGDLIFSYALAVPADFRMGAQTCPIAATDAQGRSATGNLPVTVSDLTPIHSIQGPGTTSPLAGQIVVTRGIVTGVKYNGFFIQAPDGEADADPNTSEGVFVYTGSTPGAAAVVGNLVQVSATVSEFRSPSTEPDGLSMTELQGPTTTVKSTGNDLPIAVNLSASDLNPGGSIFSLEKYEGMRVHLDEVISVSPTDGTVSEANATSTSSGVFFAVLPGTARPFREAGIETPLPVPPEAPAETTLPVFDANPERIAIDTFSVFLDPTSAAAYPTPGTTLEVTSGVTVENITGPLDYASRTYMVDTEGWNMPRATTPNMTVTPVRARTGDEFTVATMNLARFFDTDNDPHTSDAVLTSAAFAMRLQKASLAIRNVMQTPDIVGVEEVENLATLQALADQVSADGGGTYDAYLKEGHDIGGIDVGFLVRHDKVAVIGEVQQVGYDTLFSDGSFLNDRPSLVLHAEIQHAPYEPYPVTVVVNHLRSLSGIEDADPRVRSKRLAQAVELAWYLQGLQAAGEHIISVGDYNAFDANDGYVDVMGLLKGTEVGSGLVTQWAPSPVTRALFDLIDLADASQRYSYVYSGNAQELDHLLASADVHPTAIAYARMNADFPESLRGDATRPERLSDHDPIVGYFTLPDIDTTAPVLTLPSPFTVEGNAFGGARVSFTASALDAADGDIVPVCAPASGSLFRLGETTVGCTAVDAHGNVATGSFTVTVVDTTAPVISAVTPDPSSLWAPNHKMAPVTIGVWAGDAVDPAPACRITGVSGDDGASASDWLVTGPLTLSLRAERLGKGNGRTYTIGVVCVDGSGNVSQPASTTVFVPHDQKK